MNQLEICLHFYWDTEFLVALDSVLGRRMILELKSLREEMRVHFEDLPYFDVGKHSTEDSADFELGIKNQEGKQAQPFPGRKILITRISRRSASGSFGCAKLKRFGYFLST